jgi:hypothetical protein
MTPSTSDLIPAQIKIRTPTLATSLCWIVGNISELPPSCASINWENLVVKQMSAQDMAGSTCSEQYTSLIRMGVF